MKKRIILIVCMLGAIGLSNANNLVSRDELTVLAKKSGDEKTNIAESISADINGHSLTVAFLQNIGQVSIEIANVFGVTLNIEATDTPSGYMYYIPLTGNYTVTFTLENGDEYYGEFEITD